MLGEPDRRVSLPMSNGEIIQGNDDDSGGCPAEEIEQSFPKKFCVECGYPLDFIDSQICPECGQEFDPDDPSTYQSSLSQPVRLYETTDLTEATLLRNTLERASVRAVVIDTMPGFSHVALWNQTGVWVSESDLEQAQEILSDFQSRADTRRSGTEDELEWTCPNCGEDVDGSFEVCWNCEHHRPDS